jgi:predicted nucleotidyltransferase
MRLSSFETIVRALNGADVRYLVVGGVAVNAYGYGRSTYDVDMVLSLDRENIARAFTVLRESGYEPILPVTAEQFMDRETRERWHREKGMIVLQLGGDLHRDTPLDLFVQEPFDFAEEYAAAVWQEVAPGVQVPLIRLETLLAMKRASGRPKDLADLDELSLLYGKPSSYDEPS